MTGLFFDKPSDDDINYDGFFDGQNLTIPDNTELTIAVTGGFVGPKEGESINVCVIYIVVTSEGEFFGQKYKYNAKMYDMDASKRDLAKKNLGVLDAQAGFPMTNDQLELTTESIEECWVGKSEARVKFGLFMTDPEGEPDGVSREINFVRGFAYLREKMLKAGGDPVQKQAEPAQQQQADAGANIDPDDIGF